MQLTQTFVAAILAATAFAAPAPAAGKTMATGPTWTIENFKRACNDADTTCNYVFGINTGSSTTACRYIHNGKPASQTSGGPAKCGAFTITSGWSGQFGPGNGFTTLSVVRGKEIVYPAYTDKELAPEKVVSPNRAYPVIALP